MYKWAANEVKLKRAMDAVKDGTEEKIKEFYIKIGGLVLGEEREVVKLPKIKKEKKTHAPKVDN